MTHYIPTLLYNSLITHIFTLSIYRFPPFTVDCIVGSISLQKPTSGRGEAGKFHYTCETINKCFQSLSPTNEVWGLALNLYAFTYTCTFMQHADGTVRKMRLLDINALISINQFVCILHCSYETLFLSKKEQFIA